MPKFKGDAPSRKGKSLAINGTSAQQSNTGEIEIIDDDEDCQEVTLANGTDYSPKGDDGAVIEIEDEPEKDAITIEEESDRAEDEDEVGVDIEDDILVDKEDDIEINESENRAEESERNSPVIEIEENDRNGEVKENGKESQQNEIEDDDDCQEIPETASVASSGLTETDSVPAGDLERNVFSIREDGESRRPLSVERVVVKVDVDDANSCSGDPEICLSGDEDALENDDEVTMICMKRPVLTEKNVECVELCESDEEFPVCLGPVKQFDSVNAEEKQGYVKEFIETEGLAILQSGEHGLVLFSLENVWILERQYPPDITRTKLTEGTMVKFYDRSYHGPDFGLVCKEKALSQAVVVWTGPRPAHLLKQIENHDQAFWDEQLLQRNTFLMYLRGEVFIPVSLVRVKAIVMGYLSNTIGVLEATGPQQERWLIHFSEADVKIFRRPLVSYDMAAMPLILPVGLHVTVDALNTCINNLPQITHQAIVVLAGSWPQTPHPTLLPGGPGSYCPLYAIPDPSFTWYYLELALEFKLKKKAQDFQALVGNRDHLDFTWRDVNRIRCGGDQMQWQRQFLTPQQISRRQELRAQRRNSNDSRQQNTEHMFKAPKVVRFKGKTELDDGGSDIARQGTPMRRSLSSVSSMRSTPISMVSEYSMMGNIKKETSMVRSWYNQDFWEAGGLRLKRELKSEPCDAEPSTSSWAGETSFPAKRPKLEIKSELN